MNIKKILFFISSFLFLLILSGCQANNSDSNTTSSLENNQTNNTVDTNGSVTLTILNGNTKELTQNSEQVNITIKVFSSSNAPYSEGNVSVSYPDKVLSGTDVGSFQSSTVTIENGVATFVYTGPKNLQERVDNSDLSTVFGFYHDSNISNVKKFTFTYNPEANQIVITDYFLKESSSTSKYTMPLESSIQLSFYVEDDQGNLVSDGNMTSMSVQLLNPALADLKDTKSNVGDSFNFTSKNNVSLSFISSTRSGVVPIKVGATFNDVNGVSQTISEVFYMTILSGPPTAMSIAYSSSEFDSNRSKILQNMVITVTDKYFNPVNTQPAISAYLIAGYALENTSDVTSRLFFETSDAKAGTMDPATNTLTSSANFANVDLANDILLTYGNGYTYDVSGKWDISSINGNTLNLADTIGATSAVSNIGFAIGNNYRQDVCRDGQEWVGYVQLNNDRLDTTGIAKATINFDYYLTGKAVVLGIDIIGYNAETNTTTKFGEAQKFTLRSPGFSATTCSVPSGALNYPCTIEVFIGDTGEHYRNAKLGRDLQISDQLSNVRYQSGTEDNIYGCTNEGAYYEYYLVDNNDTATGTMTFTNMLTGHEF